MAAPESTKFQVNFKSPDGTLVNLYAANKDELEALLTAAQDFSALIGAVSQSFHGNTPAVSVQPSAPRAVSNPAPATTQVVEGQAPACKHGNMTFRTGTGAKGPWKGWMCAAPKGASDKCATIWAQSMREPVHYEAPLCAEIGGDWWFPERERGALENLAPTYAKSICQRCEHKIECAEWGIANEEFGIWGGLTEFERKFVRRNRRRGDVA